MCGVERRARRGRELTPAASPQGSRRITSTRRPAPGVQLMNQRVDQILPTRSSDGTSVLAPSFHLAGQTSPGCEATY